MTEVIKKTIVENNIDFVPLVSIILPIYNAEKYLKECLDSVINQTLKNIEIICVNDGSKDNSFKIIKEYATKDNRIAYIDKPNAGYGQTMNCGLDIAKGKYIGIVEPDDYIKPEMYEILYKKACENDIDIVKSDLLTFDRIDGQEHTRVNKYLIDDSKYNIITTPLNIQKYMSPSFYTTCSIYKTQLLKQNNIRYNETPGASFQDVSFWFQTHCFAKNILVLDKAFYCYRQDNPNQSIKDMNKVFCIIDEFKFVKNFIDEHQFFDFLFEYYRRKIMCYYWNYNRLDDVGRKIFSNEIKKELKKDLKNGLNIEVLSSDCKKALKKMMYFSFPWKKIFSIRNDNYKSYKIIEILGIKIKIKNKFRNSSL